MELHKIILSLRTKNNYTQERLAEMLGVSTAAVSKWECANAYPDITLLPKIAEIFGVSVDYLLGYDLTAKKSISETITQANELRKVQKYDEADHLLKQTLARYPGNAQLTFELARHRLISARYYGKTKRAELLSEAARDFQYTAEHDENKARRDWSLQYLTTICLIKQDFDQASEYNRMLLPTKGIHPLVMAAEIQMNRCADEKALKGLNDALMNCIFEIAMLIPWFTDYYMENGDYDAVIAENLRAAKIYEGFPEAGWLYYELSECYETAALAYANKNEYDRCLDCMEKAGANAILFDTKSDCSEYGINDKMNEIVIDEDPKSACASLLAVLKCEERSVYDPIRETEKFQIILKKLENA